MSEQKISAIAKMTVEVTVTLSQPWGADCTVGQVHNQASRDAIDALRIAISNARGTGSRIEISGEPKVKVITFEEKP